MVGWKPSSWRRYLKVDSERTGWHGDISIWEVGDGYYAVGFGEPSGRSTIFEELADAVEHANKLAAEFGQGWETE